MSIYDENDYDTRTGGSRSERKRREQRANAEALNNTLTSCFSDSGSGQHSCGAGAKCQKTL